MDWLRSATVFALEPSALAFLAADKFSEFMREESQLAMRIMERMSTVIRNASARIVELSTLGANNRIHAEILRLGLEKGVEKDGKIYITPVPVHNEIASRVSTARETVARAMNDLARKKIVTREVHIRAAAFGFRAQRGDTKSGREPSSAA